MSAIPEMHCGWCKSPATDPSAWMRFGRKHIPLCSACSLNIKQVLKMGNHIARMVGQKVNNTGLIARAFKEKAPNDA